MSEDHDLQSRLEALEERVNRLEGRAFVPPSQPYVRPVTPPPVIRQERLTALQQPYSTRERVETDSEREFGARVLPWIGAIAVISGLIYLVNYAIQKDLITPEMQMLGSAIFSAIFAALGAFLARDEHATKRFYGNLLVGVGSCGLYLTAAGGYAGWKLITGEAMVTSFVLLGLANLAYGLWRSLPPFVVLGMAGGMTASIMLSEKAEFPLSAGVLALVGIPALAILAGRRQGYWTIPAWAMGEIALTYWGDRPGIGTAYFVSLWMAVSCLACILGNRERESSDVAIAPAFFVGVATLQVFGVADEKWIAGLLAAAFGALFAAFAFKFESGRKVFAMVAATLVFLVAPFGLPKDQYLLTFAGIGLGLLVVSLWRYAELALFGVVSVILSVLFYVAAQDPVSGFRLPYDEVGVVATLLGVILASTVLTFQVARRRFPQIGDLDAISLILGTGASWMLVWRLVYLEIQRGVLGPQWISIAWGIGAFVAIAAGAWMHLRSLRFCGLGILMAAFARVVLVELATLEPVFKVSLLVGLGLLALAISYGFYIRPNRNGTAAH